MTYRAIKGQDGLEAGGRINVSRYYGPGGEDDIDSVGLSMKSEKGRYFLFTLTRAEATQLAGSILAAAGVTVKELLARGDEPKGRMRPK